MAERATLSVCLIVKNEEKNLEQCLASVEGLADEIIVVDTGSEDNTVSLAEKLGAKVFYFAWDDNFSNARNFALKQATMEWILMLDADEALELADHTALRDFIRDTKADGAHFIIHNYMGSMISDNVTVHNGLRLIRNNGQYMFRGEIHEQLVRIDGEQYRDKFPVISIKLHHYGYMDQAVLEKQKRNRNIPLLLKQLERAPENPFTLFNLGNEYLAMSDFQQALQYYQKAYQGMQVGEAYAPHLIFRIVNCHDHLKQFEAALKYLNIGLEIYPACTDYQYAKGCVLAKLKYPTLAIRAFEKCIEMGEAPQTLRFINNCGSFRPEISLGELYHQLKDYEKALKHYHNALKLQPNHYGLLYKLASVYNAVFTEKQEVADRLNQYFSDPSYEPNLILSIDILIHEQLYQIAEAQLQVKSFDKKYQSDYDFLMGKIKFYTHAYDTAYELFEKLVEQGSEGHVLNNLLQESSRYRFLLNLLLKKEITKEQLQEIGRLNGPAWEETCRQMAGDKDLDEEGASGLSGAVCMELLGTLLKLREFDLFQEVLPILNHMDDNRILLKLAKLYYEQGHKGIAVKTILQSVQQLGVIDYEGAEILYKEIR